MWKNGLRHMAHEHVRIAVKGSTRPGFERVPARHISKAVSPPVTEGARITGFTGTRVPKMECVVELVSGRPPKRA